MPFSFRPHIRTRSLSHFNSHFSIFLIGPLLLRQIWWDRRIEKKRNKTINSMNITPWWYTTGICLMFSFGAVWRTDNIMKNSCLEMKTEERKYILFIVGHEFSFSYRPFVESNTSTLHIQLYNDEFRFIDWHRIIFTYSWT